LRGVGLRHGEKRDRAGVAAGPLGRAGDASEDRVAAGRDLFGGDRAHESLAARSLSSAPRFARRSARPFFSRGTCRIEKRRNCLARRTASETRGIRWGALTLKTPLTCCTRRRLSDRISTVSAPIAAARARARSSALYSATLFVAVPS